MNLEKLIESHYAPKKGNDLLVKLIDSKLQESLGIPVPEITPGVATGKEKDLRKIYKTVLSSPLSTNIKQQTSMKERINIINKYLHPEKFEQQDLKLDEFMATFIFIQEFEKIIREYDAPDLDPKMAGMRFEMLTTVLLDGIELFGEMITDTVVAGENFSIKFIAERSKKQSHPIIDGSLYNLLEMFKNGQKVIYLLCLKSFPNYKFKAFYLTENNFSSILNFYSTPMLRYFDKNLTQNQLDELKKDGIIVDVKSRIFNVNVISQFENKGKLLAKHLQSIMGDVKERIQLFTPDFCRFIAEVSTDREYYVNIACSDQGRLAVSKTIIENVIYKYQKSVYEKVFKFFENSERLMNDVRDYFSSEGKTVKAISVIKDMEHLKQDFKELSGDLMSSGQVPVEMGIFDKGA